MKLTRIIAFMFFPFMAMAYRPFKSASRRADPVEAPAPELIPTFEFNSYDLLNSRSRKPDFHDEAMQELAKLDGTPVCHRIIVKLLMDDCQNIEGDAQGDFFKESSKIQTHLEESGTIGLAICDLERGRFNIPQACTPFTEAALMQVPYGKNDGMRISPEQVGDCVTALGEEGPSHWTSLASYRGTAKVVCRASRLDIDKDQAILQQKALIQIIAKFKHNLEADYQNHITKMAERVRSTDSYFEGLKSHAEQLRASLQHSAKTISADLTEAAASLKASFKTSKDLEQGLKHLLNIAIQSNGAMAVEHEKALAVNTQHTKSELQGLSEQVRATKETMELVMVAVTRLSTVTQSMDQRQDSLALKSQALEAAIISMTAMIQNHTEDLEQASFASFNILQNLQMSDKYTKLKAISHRSKTLDWALRLGGPVMGVLLGGHGVAARTAMQNVQLMVSGYVFGEGAVQIRRRNGRWFPSSVRLSDSNTPRSSTQQVQAIHTSKTAELEDDEVPAHIDMI